MTRVSRFEKWSMAVSTKSWLIIVQQYCMTQSISGYFAKNINTCLKNSHSLFSAVISEYFSKNHMITSVVAAKIWYLKNVRFLLGHPVECWYR